MAKFVQVKFAASVGIADLPATYPAECRESDDNELLAGFDAVMTPDEPMAAQLSLKPQYDVLEAARVAHEAVSEGAGRYFWR